MCSPLKINEELSRERTGRVQDEGYHIYNSRLGEWGLYYNCHMKFLSGLVSTTAKKQR